MATTTSELQQDHKVNVFLSVPASVNTSELRRTLEGRGLTPFTLEESATPGRRVSDLLDECVDRADLVVVVMPHQGQVNSNVLLELGYALARKKRILALVPPGAQVPLGEIPYLRVQPGNSEAIEFGLDQILSAPRERRRSSDAPMSKTRPIGNAGDWLLEKFHTGNWASSEYFMVGYDLVSIVADALKHSGVTAHFQTKVGFANIAVWSDDLEPWIGNPLLIKVMTRVEDAKALENAVRELCRHLWKASDSWGVLICGELRPTPAQVAEVLGRSPNILVLTVEQLLESLRTEGFGDLIRRLRNERVHARS